MGAGLVASVIGRPAADLARAQEPTPSASPVATPGVQQEFRLDLNVPNADQACDQIESTRDAVAGEEFQVAVCLLHAPEPPAVITFRVFYDDRVVLAPNVGECDGKFREADNLFATQEPGSLPDPEESLDCNPDANAGRTTFGGTSLGEGWDCTSGVVEPWGNRPPPTGNAFNGGCISPAGPYTLAADAPVAMITFRAEGEGRTALTPVEVQITGASGFATGSCNPEIDLPMPCVGGLVTVRAPGGENPLEGVDTGDGGDDWWRWAVIGGFALLFVGGAVLWFGPWRRRPSASQGRGD